MLLSQRLLSIRRSRRTRLSPRFALGIVVVMTIGICLLIMTGQLRIDLLWRVDEGTRIVVRILVPMLRSEGKLLFPWVF